MKRAVAIAVGVLTLSASLAACRAALGIDDVALEDDVTRDGGPDAALKRAEAGTDGAAPTDGGALDAGTRHDCVKICRDGLPGAPQVFEKHLRESGCVCGTGACAAECATSVCAATQAPPPSAVCPVCLDDALASGTPACRDAIARCRADATCRQLASCVETCQ